MKKLIILASAICLAFSVQAAAVSWKVTGASDWKSGTAYVITGLSSAEVIALCESTTESDWATAFEGGATGSINTRGAANSFADNVGSSVVFAFLSSGGIADGNAWAVSGDISVDGYTYTPPATKPGDLTFAYSAANVSTGTFSSVPEPTSVALLALGLAAVGLKRKVA